MDNNDFYIMTCAATKRHKTYEVTEAYKNQKISANGFLVWNYANGFAVCPACGDFHRVKGV